MEAPIQSNEDLPHLCYHIAYDILPRLVLKDPDWLVEKFAKPKHPPGALIYLMACEIRGVTPRREIAGQFKSHFGEIYSGTNYYIIQYPPLPPFDLEDRNHVLAPYFSAITHNHQTGSIRCYTLAQNPISGTTLREVTVSGSTNLGEGPVPTFDNLLRWLR